MLPSFLMALLSVSVNLKKSLAFFSIVRKNIVPILAEAKRGVKNTPIYHAAILNHVGKLCVCGIMRCFINNSGFYKCIFTVKIN
jgi:hypothetical protein